MKFSRVAFLFGSLQHASQANDENLRSDRKLDNVFEGNNPSTWANDTLETPLPSALPEKLDPFLLMCPYADEHFRCPQPNKNRNPAFAYICHTNPSNGVEMNKCVRRNQLASRGEKHGDYCGACETVEPLTCPYDNEKFRCPQRKKNKNPAFAYICHTNPKNGVQINRCVPRNQLAWFGDKHEDNHCGKCESSPSQAPTDLPLKAPSDRPSQSQLPSDLPSQAPSDLPSWASSDLPSRAPSHLPSQSPSDLPSQPPSDLHSQSPSDLHSRPPSDRPSQSQLPSDLPSQAPSDPPSWAPSDLPSRAPSDLPSQSPSDLPSQPPSDLHSQSPSDLPSRPPSDRPSQSQSPSDLPSRAPSDPPSQAPSDLPSQSPSDLPSQPPSDLPSQAPTAGISESLEEAILKDMMPLSSSQCQSPSDQTSSGFTFASSQAESNWYTPYVDLEQHVFLAKMTHTDANENRTWTIRLGKAGNIYSFVGPMGETVPPQSHPEAPWIDEVWQSVSVDLSKNKPADGTPYFIHEAGTYQRDAGYNETMGVPLAEIPFYSPSLGKHCDDESGECSFMSWGQQAHVPTDFTSGMLNFNRYKDCGDGVFEYTTLRHNNVGNEDALNYLNVPWGGVRKSTLSDLVVPFKSGERQYDSLPGWGSGDTTNTIFPVSDTEGYVMFPEDLPDLNTGIKDGDPYALPVNMVLKIGGNCAESPRHTTRWSQYTVRCPITGNTVEDGTGARATAVRLTSSITNSSVTAQAGVLHWAWKGTYIYFWPDVSDAAVRLALPAGSVISVSYYVAPPAKSVEDNLALGHVFGTSNSNRRNDIGGVARSDTRLRWGSSARDFQVYTINSTPTITGGMTYYYRQYFMVDRFEDMRATGRKWAPEAHQALYAVDTPSVSPIGRSVELFASTSSSGVFGAVVGMVAGEGCVATSTAGAASVCVGSTTPKATFQALYQVRCGSTYAVTNNPYYFAPGTLPNRPYICEGQSTERPEYKLLGFFDAVSCAPIAASFHFDETFC